MHNDKNWNNKNLEVLADQFEVMSQKGTVGFYEEAVIESLVEYFWNNNRIDMAQCAAQWGIDLYPYSSSIIYLNAQLLYFRKKYPSALHELDRAIALDPMDSESRLLKARILIEMERYDQASETLENISNFEGSTNHEATIHLCYAAIYENLDRHADMFDSLCNALRLDWDNEEIVERLGLCVEFSQRHEDHIHFLQEYLDERPYSSIAWYNLGHSYWYQKDYENASDAFEYAFYIDKYFQQAYVDCAEVFIKMGLYERALSCFEDAMEYCPKDGELYIGRGNSLFMMKDYEKALVAYSEATLVAPKNPDGYYGKGLCLMEMKCAKQALEAFGLACKLDDRREEFAAALGEAYYSLGNMGKASEAFNRAIELAPEMSEYWVRLITFLMDEERYDEALENLNGAFLNTYGTELMYCHAAYCFKTGNRKEGMDLLEGAMIENYNMHESFLDLCPYLEKDNEIMAFIATHRPLDTH